jgi:SAM-dependent methyltransferase
MSQSDEVVALPPKELIDRVGDDPGDTVERYLEIGTRHREVVEGYLPSDWVWSAKTYLDWGAGAGRLIRHFLPEAATNRIIAADIHAPSIEWIRDKLAPIEGVVVDVEPAIDLEDNSVDLVTGFSVMTHITDYWAGWLLEIRRILKPGGLALFSFCGSAMVPVLLDKPVQMDDIGMLVIKYGNPWSFGGPTVLHSPWWIRTHWGRALDIVRVNQTELQGIEHGHDLVLLHRPSGPPPSVAELENLEPGEPREVKALASALQQSRAELAALRGDFERVRHAAYVNGLVADDRGLQLAYIRASHSWRVTRPIRRLAGRLGRTGGSTLE